MFGPADTAKVAYQKQPRRDRSRVVKKGERLGFAQMVEHMVAEHVIEAFIDFAKTGAPGFDLRIVPAPGHAVVTYAAVRIDAYHRQLLAFLACAVDDPPREVAAAGAYIEQSAWLAVLHIVDYKRVRKTPVRCDERVNPFELAESTEECFPVTRGIVHELRFVLSLAVAGVEHMHRI